MSAFDEILAFLTEESNQVTRIRRLRSEQDFEYFEQVFEMLEIKGDEDEQSIRYLMLLLALKETTIDARVEFQRRFDLVERLCNCFMKRLSAFISIGSVLTLAPGARSAGLHVLEIILDLIKDLRQNSFEISAATRGETTLIWNNLYPKLLSIAKASDLQSACDGIVSRYENCFNEVTRVCGPEVIDLVSSDEEEVDTADEVNNESQKNVESTWNCPIKAPKSKKLCVEAKYFAYKTERDQTEEAESLFSAMNESFLKANATIESTDEMKAKKAASTAKEKSFLKANATIESTDEMKAKKAASTNKSFTTKQTDTIESTDEMKAKKAASTAKEKSFLKANATIESTDKMKAKKAASTNKSFTTKQTDTIKPSEQMKAKKASSTAKEKSFLKANATIESTDEMKAKKAASTNKSFTTKQTDTIESTDEMKAKKAASTAKEKSFLKANATIESTDEMKAKKAASTNKSFTKKTDTIKPSEQMEAKKATSTEKQKSSVNQTSSPIPPKIRPTPEELTNRISQKKEQHMKPKLQYLNDVPAESSSGKQMSKSEIVDPFSKTVAEKTSSEFSRKTKTGSNDSLNDIRNHFIEGNGKRKLDVIESTEEKSKKLRLNQMNSNIISIDCSDDEADNIPGSKIAPENISTAETDDLLKRDSVVEVDATKSKPVVSRIKNDDLCARCGDRSHSVGRCPIGFDRVYCYRCYYRGHVKATCPE